MSENRHLIEEITNKTIEYIEYLSSSSNQRYTLMQNLAMSLILNIIISSAVRTNRSVEQIAEEVLEFIKKDIHSCMPAMKSTCIEVMRGMEKS